MELCTFYTLMPGKDCGICGHGSCNTFSRHVIFKKELPQKCAWLDEKGLNQISTVVEKVNPVKTQVQTLFSFNPCVTDSQMIMAEVYLASREVDYGLWDPVFCDYLPWFFNQVKCSKILGITRIEHDEKEILVSQTGKVIIRHAQNEKDVLQICELILKINSEAAICPCLATGLECVSKLCTCAECEILGKVGPPPLDKETKALIAASEQNAATALSRLSDNEPPPLLDLTPLKVKAMTVLSRTINGLEIQEISSITANEFEMRTKANIFSGGDVHFEDVNL